LSPSYTTTRDTTCRRGLRQEQRRPRQCYSGPREQRSSSHLDHPVGQLPSSSVALQDALVRSLQPFWYSLFRTVKFPVPITGNLLLRLAVGTIFGRFGRHHWAETGSFPCRFPADQGNCAGDRFAPDWLRHPPLSVEKIVQGPSEDSRAILVG